MRRHLNSFAQRSFRHFVVPACYTMFLPKSKKRKQKSVFEMVRKNKANFSKNAGNENFCDCLTTVDNIYATVCVFLLHKKRLEGILHNKTTGIDKKENMKDFIFQQTGIALTGEQEKQLEYYCDFLLEENEKYNLTAITEREAVWEKHFADSMLGSVFLKKGVSLCDIGSGAGFPSLPLKILRPDIDVTLVDSLQKRINFTQMLCQKLGISANFYHQRAEDFAKTNREAFDVATARAVAPLPVLLEYTAQIVKVGGSIVAYKTDLEESLTAKNACKVLGLVLTDSKNFTLPDGSRRCILQYVKKTHTPTQYPRGQNKPRKSPL